MRLLFVRRGREDDLFAPMAEVTIEPAHESVDCALKFHIKAKGAIEIQLSYGNLLEIDVVEFIRVSKDVLVLNRVDYWLRENPFLHAFHADSINVIPEILGKQR
jgi:hypothetical protein